MILITGTEMPIESLPMYEVMDYQIENDMNRMGIKLRTLAKGPTCFNIYIPESQRIDYTIDDVIAPKIVYYKDDEALIKLLNSGNGEINDPFAPSEPEEPPIEVPTFEPPVQPVEPEKEEKPKEEVKETKKAKKEENAEQGNEEETVETSTEGAEEAKESSVEPLEELNDTDLPDDFLQIPNIADDTNSLQVQLKAKEKVIAQKDGMIADLKKSIEDSYKQQEMQVYEIEKLWQEKVDELNRNLEEYQEKDLNSAISADERNFLKFLQYAQSAKAVVKEDMSDSEKKILDKLSSDYHIFATSAGDSNYSFLKELKKFIDGNPSCMIVDFSNDNFLAATYKIKSNTGNSLGLFKDEINPSTLVQSIGTVRLIPTTSYNDIALLNVDWVKVIQKIDELAVGRPVILIFGSINNFVVRYTVSKLASVFKLDIFVKCSPIVLTSLYSDIKFIPSSRINSIVALEYIPVVKNILQGFSTTYNINAFSGSIEWNKLGLK